ncbi:hypothetical protein ACFLQL_01270 [Verrucomicrobiota bacterium]
MSRIGNDDVPLVFTRRQEKPGAGKLFYASFVELLDNFVKLPGSTGDLYLYAEEEHQQKNEGENLNVRHSMFPFNKVYQIILFLRCPPCKSTNI